MPRLQPIHPKTVAIAPRRSSRWSDPVRPRAFGIALVFTCGAFGQAPVPEGVVNEEDLTDGIVDQWSDFPTGREIEFSGYTWRVKGSGPERRYGPGGFPFGPTEQSVWVDDDGRLHLRVTEIDGVWHSAEVRLVDALGHGDYRFTTVGRVDDIDPNLVFGLFLWEYQASYEGSDERNVANEFDIEFSIWKDSARAPGQFVCQPWTRADNLHGFRFSIADDDALSTHAFRWQSDRVACRGWHGGSEAEMDPEAQIVAWTYEGPHIPEGAPQIHLNLWCFREPPARGESQEVILDRFEFIPLAE